MTSPPTVYDLYVDGLAQNYWVDAEVTPATGSTGRLAPAESPPKAESGTFLTFFP